MADNRYGLARLNIRVGIGTQDYTDSALGGATPKAALILYNYAVTDGVATDDLLVGVGMCDGTRQRCVWCSTNHNGSFEHSQQMSNVNLIEFPDAGTVTISGIAQFDSFIPNGLRINVTDAFETSIGVTVVLFAGADLSAHVNHFALGVEDVAVDVTDPGFEPSIVIPVALGTGFIPVDTSSRITIGAVHNDGVGGVTQAMQAVNYGSQLGDGADQTGMVNTFYGTGQLFEGPPAQPLSWAGEFGSFDASGFSCTSRLGDATSDPVNYLALDFGGDSSWVGVIDSPIVTGDWSITDPGFTPGFVMLLLSMQILTTLGGTPGQMDNTCPTIGISTFTPTIQVCTAETNEFGSISSNSQSLSDDIAVNLAAHDGVQAFASSAVVAPIMDANGFTVNFPTTVDGTARKIIGLAMQEGSVAVGTSLPGIGHKFGMGRSLMDGLIRKTSIFDFGRAKSGILMPRRLVTR